MNAKNFTPANGVELNNNSGNSVKIVLNEECDQIISNDNSAQISSDGNYVKIISNGNFTDISSNGSSVKITSNGYSSKISSNGYAAKIESTGENAVITATGSNTKVKANIGSWITLTQWKKDHTDCKWKPVFVKTEQVDGERIKADTFYKLVDGKFEE